jgi:outer membrane lipoprotein carrier protein
MFRMRFFLITMIFWLTTACVIGVAYGTPDSDAKAAAHALEARYQGAKTLKAEFFERYSDGSGGVMAESGTVYFSRPGRMRWEYESPEKKLFLVDGANAWFYIPADRTASRAKMKESSDWRTPLSLLVGKANLAKICRDIQVIRGDAAAQSADAGNQPVAAGDTILRCIPRDAPAKDTSQQVLLETDPQAYLVRVVIHEPGNVETEFRFGKWQENIPLPESEFHFQPPEGVSIVDEESLAQQVH